MTAHISQPAADTASRTIHGKWRFCLAVALIALLAACWPDGLMRLRYDRSGLMDGEMWRVVTAHLVHLNRPHVFLNLLGLLLICELQWGALPLRQGIGLLGFSGMAISASLWWLHPELVWYAGLSGALHGLWAGCVLFGLRPVIPIPDRNAANLLPPTVRPELVEGQKWQDDCGSTGSPRTGRLLMFLSGIGIMETPLRSRLPYLAGALLLAAKLLMEFHGGASENTAHLIGGGVVTVSHLYGALAGAAYILTQGCVRMHASFRGALPQR